MTPPGSIRRAVIDVGTNSTKLLVADVRGRDVWPVWEESKQTRLGRGFYEAHRLQPESIAKTAAAVGQFAASARQFEAVVIRVIATSAARDAKNPEELVSAIAEASNLKPEIISGEQEALWVFKGVTSDTKYAQAPLLLLDVGGGSTELIVGRGEQKHFSHSYPMGTVRLMEKIPYGDPPTSQELAQCRSFLRQFMETEVKPQVGPVLRQEAKAHHCTGGIQLVGTGGTTTILARMEARTEDFDREQLESVCLSLEQMRNRVESLWGLSLAERKRIIGLPKSRADVILTGSVICEAMMESLGFHALRISTRGLRFAAVMERA
jgi:exopolyphosphatase / guanosine-5'-triphosphate,3'-diphosphate pyrophosphatase